MYAEGEGYALNPVLLFLVQMFYIKILIQNSNAIFN